MISSKYSVQLHFLSSTTFDDLPFILNNSVFTDKKIYFFNGAYLLSYDYLSDLSSFTPKGSFRDTKVVYTPGHHKIVVA